MDGSLRYALALHNPVKFAARGALRTSSVSSVISFATRPLISSYSTIPRSCSIWSFLVCSLASCVCTHISSYDMSLLTSWSLCVVVASCVPTFPRSSGTGPSSAITSLMMTSNFSMIFVELSRSRQELPCEVLRHHFPHHKCLLRFGNRFDLMLHSTTFNDHAVSFFFNSAASLHLGCRKYGLQRHSWVVRCLGRMTISQRVPRTHDLAPHG